uniref:Uncharacterized protein n=1 Tax=Acrobeloides nanus TaxID=290746 RepID=A0A914CUK6_9BILA
MMGASESTQEPEPIESDIQETFSNIPAAPVSPVASNLAELSVASTSTSNTSARLDRDILVEIVQEMVYQKMDTDDGSVNANNSDFWLRFALVNKNFQDAILSFFQRYHALVLDETSLYYNVRLRRHIAKTQEKGSDIVIDESLFRSLMKFGSFIRELEITPSGYESPKIDFILNAIIDSALEKIKLNDFKKSYELSRNRILEIIKKNSHTLKELHDVPYHFLRYISSIPLNLDYFSAFQMDLGME